MKLKHQASTLLITAFFVFPLYLLSRSTGSPEGNSGGNFPGEGSCATSSCHDSEPNQGPGTLSITIHGAPADQYRYTPGETVPVAVRLSDASAARIGFQLTARAGDGCDPAGNLAPAESQVSVSSGPCNSNDVQWSTHRFPKPGNDATFTTDWTAPASDIGPVTFAAAGNGADGMGNRLGDNIYHIEAVTQPAAVSSGPAPAVNPNGIVLATLSPTVTTGAPNAIVSAFGTEFAPLGADVRNPQLDDAGKIGTVSAETCVEVNGRLSPIFAVSPMQINFQIPDQTVAGPASVTIIRGCGTANEQRSSVASFDIAAVQPAFFLIDFARPAIAAAHGGGPSIVGPADLIPGITTPAAPGEYISLFGTGFGATDPQIAAGEIPQTVNPAMPLTALPAAANVSVRFSGIDAPDIFYIGGAPCCAGLYQLVVQVPANAPDGDLPVQLTINGISSPEGPFITVQAPL